MQVKELKGEAMKDKYNKVIEEADIVKFVYGGVGSIGMILEHKNELMIRYNKDLYLDISKCNEITVIGNMFDDPDKFKTDWHSIDKDLVK